MAKKKTETKTSIVEDVPDGTIPDGTISGVNGGEFSFDTATVVKVYKLFPGKNKPAFCFETTDDVTETQLQNSYGGGSYTIEYHYGNGTIKPVHWEIADKPTATQDMKPRSIEEVQIMMLQEQSKMNRDLLMAVLGRGNPPATPMTEIAQIWGLIHGANGNGNGGFGFDKLLEIFKTGLELGKVGGGEMDWKGMLVNTIREVAPTVTNVIAQAKGLNPPPHTIAEIPEDMLMKGIATVKRQILAGLPVSMAVEWMSVNANDPQYQPLIKDALKKSFEDFVKLDPELATEPFNSWMRKFIEGVKETFKDQIADDGELE